LFLQYYDVICPLHSTLRSSNKYDKPKNRIISV
jgi:hypothetical protein